MKYYIIVLILLLHAECIGDRHKAVTCQATDTSFILKDIDLRRVSVKDYINIIRNTKIDQQGINRVVVIAADTGWVKKNDIPFLMKLLPSTKPVPCVMNILSSELPFDKSTLGGHAAALIDSYKLHTSFPVQLTACPETNSSEIGTLQKWWVSQDH